MIRNDKNWWNGTKEVRKDLANKVKDYNGSKKDLKNVLSGKKTDMTLDQAKGNVKGKYKDVQSAKGKLDGKIKEGEQLKKDHSKELQKVSKKPKYCKFSDYKLPLNNQTSKEVAKRLGFEKTNFKAFNEKPIYKKGNKYISADADGHNGGAWKIADSVKKIYLLKQQEMGIIILI